MSMWFRFCHVMAYAVFLFLSAGDSPFSWLSLSAHAEPFYAADDATRTHTGPDPYKPDPYKDDDGAICIRSEEPFIDPGYCAGLSMAYMETLGDTKALAMVAENRTVDTLKDIHQQCHATRFDSAFGLGQAAFHRMLYYASPDRLNTRLGQCLGMLRYYRLSWPGDGGRGKD